jgi:hypothetical protein
MGGLVLPVFAWGGCLSNTTGDEVVQDVSMDSFRTADATLEDAGAGEDSEAFTDGASLLDAALSDASSFDAPLEDTPVPDGDAADGASEDGGVLVDVNPEPVPQSPTWFECRKSMVSGVLTPDQADVCKNLHSADPGERHYGIRWVFIDEEVVPEDWIAPRLAVLNSLFSPALFTFSTESIVVIEGSGITDPGKETGLTFKGLSSDTAQHLGLAEDSPEEVLAALKTTLSSKGVSEPQLEALTLDGEVSAKEYVGTIARARPTEIHVIVSPLLNGQSGGGLSSGPGTNPTSGRVSVVYHRSAESVASTVLAHEMGHYFGLKHPHTKLQEKADSAEANFEDIVKKSPFPVEDQIEALKEHLGPQLADQPLALYPAWNGSQKDVIQPFEAYRYGLSLIWLTKDYLYRGSENGPKGFESTAAFLEAGQKGDAMFYKNFGWSGNGDNCGWNEKQDMFVCSYGTPNKNVKGTNPLLDGSITLEEGQRVNVMSYIGKTVPNKEDLPDRVDFHPNALTVLKVHANTPVRLMLRNLAL